MKLLILSNAPLIKKDSHWNAYGPYVKEMQIWAKYSEEVAFCCPQWKEDNGLLISEIPFPIKKFFFLIDFNTKTSWNILKTIFLLPYNCFVIWKAMFWADHIHLRCPGNVGLLGAMIQILFPFKTKTVKYAGNWGPNVTIPFSYRLQKSILSNVRLSKKMKVLVYGAWEKATANIVPFFTATYQEKDKEVVLLKNYSNKIEFVFVGMLTEGKQPLYAIQVVEALVKKGFSVTLHLYGEGKERSSLENYIRSNELQNNVQIVGNVSSETLKEVYKKAHFVILPSKSEGWPKAIAEGMFWGCVPIATKISCIPFMLNDGDRGVLLDLDCDKDVKTIENLLQYEAIFQKMQMEAMHWSRYFTLDRFEMEIKALLQSQ